MSTKDNTPTPAGRGSLTPSPQALALHKNFLNSVSGLKRELVRSIFYLTAISDRRVYRMLGYKTIAAYAASEAGLSEDQCRAFLKIGRKLGDLPEMKKALEEGLISWSKARILVGKADKGNEASLVDLASSLGEAELRLSLRSKDSGPVVSREPPKRQPSPGPCGIPESGSPAGGKPTQPPVQPDLPPAKPAEDVQHVLFKFTAEQYALWQSLTVGVAGGSKEEKLLAALNSAGGAGRRGYLIILQECPACGRARHNTSRGTFEAPKALLETAKCDGTLENVDARRKRIIPPRLRRKVLRRDNHQCQAPDCQNTSYLQLHHRLPIAQGGQTTEENLITLCNSCHRQLHEQETALRAVNRGPEV